MLQQQLSELIEDEGSRTRVYDDATGLPIGPGSTVLGHPTIGIGRALDVHGLAPNEVAYLLHNDIGSIEASLSKQTWWVRLDPVRQGVMVNLAFNLGLHGLALFVRMIAACMMQDWSQAAAELQNSQWARQVEAERRDRLLEQLTTGQLAKPSTVLPATV
jgi:lysozyme